jgi:SpoVK/Ycf46/Vps4 family AAA+-type ATPase
MPGFKDGSISGAAVGGPIGGGKTFICEAVAAELGVPVIILKNIRSMWYGETDQIFERLRRLLESFHKVVIFVDEADTQFGGVDDGHETERRLTGKIQAMMSDPRLKGRVIWFLMTARIHRLSPDIRRPGRMDLIIPVLDPEGEELDEFINWTFKGVDQPPGGFAKNVEVHDLVKKFSPASFASLRSRIKSKNCKTLEEVLMIASDMLEPDIEETREYQTLQAKVNCTRKSLLFDPNTSATDVAKARKEWKTRIKELEAKGQR